ncbi:MAG: DUF5643 domain-containing protein, partial [Thermotaleaceae bacterium]
EIAGTWEIDIPIDKEQFNAIKEVYPIDKTVEIQGQRIYFDTLIIYPTRMVLDVKYDERNTIKLFDFEGLKITDEKGEWLTISNGMSASIIDDYSKKIYFQSNYFNKPKEIYLEWEAIRGLDKDKLEVIVDLDKQELLKNPDNKLLFDGMYFLNGRAGKGENKEILFKFLLEKNDGMPYMHYQILEGSFYDVTGKKIESMGYSTSTSVKNDKVYEEIGYHIPADVNIKSPITFKIIDYPNRIKIPHRLKIK